MDIYIILWLMTNIFLIAQIVPALAVESWAGLLLCSFDMLPTFPSFFSTLLFSRATGRNFDLSANGLKEF